MLSVKEADERLEFIIATNDICNKCLAILANPEEKKYLMDSLFENIEALKPQAIRFMDSTEGENEYYRKIMLGDDEIEESNGVLHLIQAYINKEGLDIEAYEDISANAVQLIYDVKNQLIEVFNQAKKSQVVKYIAYGVEDEIDFGKYTVEDLTDL